MGLPYAIEYLLTIRRASGGSLVHQGGSQVEILQVPPYRTFTIQQAPFGSDYLDIVYEAWFDPSMVPGAFSGYLQYFGARQVDGIFSSAFMAHPFNGLVFISNAEPALIYVRNLTNQHQFYSGNIFFIAIASEEDFNIILEHLKGVGTVETNRLLVMLKAVMAGEKSNATGN